MDARRSVSCRPCSPVLHRRYNLQWLSRSVPRRIKTILHLHANNEGSREGTWAGDPVRVLSLRDNSSMLERVERKRRMTPTTNSLIRPEKIAGPNPFDPPPHATIPATKSPFPKQRFIPRPQHQLQQNLLILLRPYRVSRHPILLCFSPPASQKCRAQLPMSHPPHP